MTPIPLEFSGIEKITVSNLREAVSSYYTAEDSYNWKKAYAFRSEAFKKLVPFDTYESEMNKGMAGWDLVKVEVMNVKRLSEDKQVLQIRFHEKFDKTVAKKTFSNRIPAGVVNTTIEEVEWQYINKTWICLQAGQRGHLPLNDQIVY